MQQQFTVSEVARIFGLKESRLRYWAQTGFINPTGRDQGKLSYTFGDLVEVRAAKELLERQIPLQRVRRNLQALRSSLPGKANLLGRLRVCSDGDSLVVVDGVAALEPISGQLVLDFQLSDVDQAIASVLELRARKSPGSAEPPTLSSRRGVTVPEPSPRQPSSAAAVDAANDAAPADEARSGAYAYYTQGLQLEAQAGQHAAAIEAYQRALALDPGLAAAHTNLGNLHYRCGDRSAALRHYATALSLDPDQPEAHYNLANIYDEEGDLELAIAELRRAIKLAPELADAHYNLALALERVGSRHQAAQHWRNYLDLTAHHTELAEWRALAQEHLQELQRSQQP